MKNIKKSKTDLQIYGKLIDNCGRCVHYGSPLDIIANRCAECGKLYACYKCHNEMESHPFKPQKSSEGETVICGNCRTLFSYKEYSRLSCCPVCQSEFNPRCSAHKCIYAF